MIAWVLSEIAILMRLSGVGGIGSEAQSAGISGLINWIGVGPHKKDAGKRGPEVTFERFIYFGKDGADFRAHAPLLSKRMYSKNVRSIIDGMTDDEKAEAMVIVEWANEAPASPSLIGTKGSEVVFDKCKRDGRLVQCKKSQSTPKKQEQKCRK